MRSLCMIEMDELCGPVGGGRFFFGSWLFFELGWLGQMSGVIFGIVWMEGDLIFLGNDCFQRDVRSGEKDDMGFSRNPRDPWRAGDAGRVSGLLSAAFDFELGD